MNNFILTLPEWNAGFWFHPTNIHFLLSVICLISSWKLAVHGRNSGIWFLTACLSGLAGFPAYHLILENYSGQYAYFMLVLFLGLTSLIILAGLKGLHWTGKKLSGLYMIKKYKGFRYSKETGSLKGRMNLLKISNFMADYGLSTLGCILCGVLVYSLLYQHVLAGAGVGLLAGAAAWKKVRDKNNNTGRFKTYDHLIDCRTLLETGKEA